jgi:hypothetical protein
MAFDFNQFMTLVRQDNPNFKRFTRTSHLDPIIEELKDKKFITPALKERLEKLVAFLPHDRQQTYRRALAYLTTQGGVRVLAVPTKPVMKYVGFYIEKGGYTGYDQRGGSKFVYLDPDSTGSPGPRSFLHRHTITWSSSNGNIASLAQVRTREYVKFLQDTQAPPFNKIQDPDREFYAPGLQGSIGASSGTDDHSTKLPALICCYPRQPGTLIAQQWYQYSIDNGANWSNIEGAAYLIEKTVRRDGSDWVYVFKKSNWPEHNPKRFHFEVHYTIGDPPDYMPRTDTDVLNAGTSQADIKDWARKVVSTG